MRLLYPTKNLYKQHCLEKENMQKQHNVEKENLYKEYQHCINQNGIQYHKALEQEIGNLCKQYQDCITVSLNSFTNTRDTVESIMPEISILCSNWTFLGF